MIANRQNGVITKERLYLGGYEVYREYDPSGSTVTLERQSLHVMDDKQRIALVETRTQGSNPASQAIRYQFGNHLGSASVELDDLAQLISYEEYFPYGGTSYQAGRSVVEVSLKRYRFTEMERDEESGLNYHHARYYATWIGRWISCDPTGVNDGVNLFQNAKSNPIRFVDLSGTDNSETTVVTPAVRHALTQAGLPYAEQVKFELLDKSGKVETTGQFDFVFRDPRTGANNRLIIPELKGLNVDKFHANQPQYIPVLEAVGGRLRITSVKAGHIGLTKGAEVLINNEDFLRVGTGNLADFTSALREIIGGKPVVGRFITSGAVKTFTSEKEWNEFVSKLSPAPSPPGTPKQLTGSGPKLLTSGGPTATSAPSDDRFGRIIKADVEFLSKVPLLYNLVKHSFLMGLALRQGQGFALFKQFTLLAEHFVEDDVGLFFKGARMIGTVVQEGSQERQKEFDSIMSNPGLSNEERRKWLEWTVLSGGAMSHQP